MTKQYSPIIYHYNKNISDKAINEFKQILDIGCGYRKFPNAIGIDKIENGNVNIKWDLNDYPWPLKDNSFDLIIAQHSLEHLNDVVKTMEEIYRIGKNGARVLIQVPFFRNLDAISDITHKHLFSTKSMDYFLENTKVFNYHYSMARFEQVGMWLGWPSESKNLLRGFLKSFINKFPNFYEKYLSIIYPVKNIAWELIVKKI